jgi:hypothetical protein
MILQYQDYRSLGHGLLVAPAKSAAGVVVQLVLVVSETDRHNTIYYNVLVHVFPSNQLMEWNIVLETCNRSSIFSIFIFI